MIHYVEKNVKRIHKANTRTSRLEVVEWKNTGNLTVYIGDACGGAFNSLTRRGARRLIRLLQAATKKRSK